MTDPSQPTSSPPPENSNPANVTPPAGEAPLTWQAALISFIWRSRHRDRIVIGAALLLSVPFLWTVATTNIGPATLLGRTLGAIQASRTPDLPPRQENNPAYFAVLERHDFVDLDTYREVPSNLTEYNVCPTVRETKLLIQKISPSLTTFYNHTKTTGRSHDVVCLSGQPFEVHRIASDLSPGEQMHHEYELAVNIASAPVASKLDLRWQVVAWNKYQGENNWWTSVVAAYDIPTLTLTVDFPKDAGITLDDITLKSRRKPDVAFRETTDRSQLTLDPSTAEVRWRVPNAKINTEYAIFWRKSLAVLRPE